MLTRGGAFGQRRCRHIIRMWQAAGGVERGGEWEEWEDALLHNTMCMEGGMEGGMDGHGGRWTGMDGGGSFSHLEDGEHARVEVLLEGLRVPATWQGRETVSRAVEAG